MQTTPMKKGECDCCLLQEDRSSFLYNVRHRGIYRRLCTACVLKNHPGSFCPICFDVFDDNYPPPPPHLRVMCLLCPSISHPSCVHRLTTTSLHDDGYRCPPCSNPNFSFFDFSKCGNKKIKSVAGEQPVRKSINQDLAKQMVAAAKIAVASMNKGVAVARLEAEKRAKEAAVATKAAKESLERLAYLMSKESMESKSITGPQKINAEIDSPCLAQNWIQTQIKPDGHGLQLTDNLLAPQNNGASVPESDGQIHKGEAQKSNGLHPVSKHH